MPLLLLAQQKQQQKPRLIYLEHANTLSFDKAVDEERQVLRGDVLFRQDSIYMSCDSAYFYQSRNSFEAFSNVEMWEGDTLHLWCDSLSYDGDKLEGELFDNVRMRHNDTELHTEYMIYYRQEGKAHYPYSGYIMDPDNHLLSDLGWYYTQTKLSVFRNNVVMRHYDFSKMGEERPLYPDPDSESYRPDMTLYGDTLHYNFESDDAWILGPSKVVNDTATLYTNLGTINTQSQQSWLYDHSYVVSPGRYTTADTLFYDGLAGYGDGWGHFLAYDTIQHMSVLGDYAHYTDLPQTITVTGHALAKEFSSSDTLYLHADTLRTYSIFDEKVMQVPADTLVSYDTIKVWQTEMLRDSLLTDSVRIDSILVDSIVVHLTPQVRDSAYTDTIHYLTCHFNVRYYRSDMQGVCDSLNYNHHDSIATFIGNPVMWNQNYQITGDTIFTVMAPSGGIERALVHDQAFLILQHDSLHYDQISGKDLVCYFDSSRIQRMDMSGNVQIIFYPEDGKDEEKSLIGLNQVIGNYLSIWFINQKMEHLRVWPQPVGSLTPLHLVTEDILYLEGFRWMDYLRPTDPMDVFRDVRMKSEDKVESIRLFNDDELNGW
ncbi:MAG: hypothetical protein KBT20_03100 [Bacteroidales bacterium]|nr:hypothetical protein [Candidatus Liminaster caballi]